MGLSAEFGARHLFRQAGDRDAWAQFRGDDGGADAPSLMQPTRRSMRLPTLTAGWRIADDRKACHGSPQR
jgi:hypothetical protein